jgi:hypothetical protein
LPSGQIPVGGGKSAFEHQSLTGRCVPRPIAASAFLFASVRDWFHFSHRS